MTLSSLSSKECHWNFICIVKFDDLQREKKKEVNSMFWEVKVSFF
jgi:hypothetical protein